MWINHTAPGRGVCEAHTFSLWAAVCIYFNFNLPSAPEAQLSYSQKVLAYSSRGVIAISCAYIITTVMILWAAAKAPVTETYAVMIYDRTQTEVTFWQHVSESPGPPQGWVWACTVGDVSTYIQQILLYQGGWMAPLCSDNVCVLWLDWMSHGLPWHRWQTQILLWSVGDMKISWIWIHLSGINEPYNNDTAVTLRSKTGPRPHLLVQFVIAPTLCLSLARRKCLVSPVSPFFWAPLKGRKCESQTRSATTADLWKDITSRGEIRGRRRSEMGFPTLDFSCSAQTADGG